VVTRIKSVKVKKPRSKSRNRESCIPQSQVKFANGMRKLWIEHALWTHNVIISIITDSPDTKVFLDRLLRNQDDIGNYIKPYYGTAAGNQLASLLREHINIAGQLVTAAKMGDKEDFDKYNQMWYANADSIVEFLSKANPMFSEAELKNMFHTHLQQVTDLVVARLNQDYVKEVKAYDVGQNHLIDMADYLSKGIIKQFPQRFK